MRKNIVKIGFLLVILVTTLVLVKGFFFSLSSAELINPDDYKSSYSSNKGSQKLSDMAGIVLGTINVVGAFISVGMLMVIGIKFMMGSIEEKAEYKKTMIPYIIGAILLFSGTNILNVIYKLATIN